MCYASLVLFLNKDLHLCGGRHCHGSRGNQSDARLRGGILLSRVKFSGDSVDIWDSNVVLEVNSAAFREW